MLKKPKEDNIPVPCIRQKTCKYYYFIKGVLNEVFPDFLGICITGNTGK